MRPVSVQNMTCKGVLDVQEDFGHVMTFSVFLAKGDILLSFHTNNNSLAFLLWECNLLHSMVLLSLLICISSMWPCQFWHILVCPGTLLQNAPQNRCAGTVENLVTWPATVPMRASATLVVRLDTVLKSARLPHYHLGTWGCATTAISRVILQLTVQMKRHVIIVGRRATWHVTVQTILSATCAM